MRRRSIGRLIKGRGQKALFQAKERTDKGKKCLADWYINEVFERHSCSFVKEKWNSRVCWGGLDIERNSDFYKRDTSNTDVLVILLFNFKSIEKHFQIHFEYSENSRGKKSISVNYEQKVPELVWKLSRNPLDYSIIFLEDYSQNL